MTAATARRRLAARVRWWLRKDQATISTPYTNAYLAALARHHHGRLATLDRGLAAVHGEVVEWLSS